MPQQPLLDLNRRTGARVHKTANAATGHHTMTGNHQWNAIGAAGATDRTRRATNLPRDITISQRTPGRNFTNRLPHALTKRTAVKFKRQLKAELWIIEVAFNLPAGCLREAVLR